MTCPQSTEYNEAIQNLHSSVSDEELRQGQVAVGALGLPMAWSGNFADVYRVHCPETGNTWAVKCFTRESPGLKERYREISAHLRQARLPFMVDFQFVEPGIRVGQQWYPFLKMHWVEGLTLNEFLGQYLGRRKTLRKLLPLWQKLATRLREARIAHADLQHGNVLLVPMPQGQLALRLIDYDGMYVPALSGTRSAELGHPAYQHPQRLREGIYSLEVDRFSHLAIFCTVRCLIAGQRELWRFHTGENLLFRERDFANPENSEVFRTLWSLPDEEARSLVGRLFLAAQGPLAETPLLEDVLSNGSVVPLSREEQGKVESALGGGSSAGRVSPGTAAQAEQGRSAPDADTYALLDQPHEPPEGVSSEEAPTEDPPWWGAGTLPDAASGTQSAEVVLPRKYPLKDSEPEKEQVRGLGYFAGAVLRWPDGVLRAMAGEDNVILHNFLRIAAVAVPGILVFLGLRMGPQLLGSAVALIASRYGPTTEATEADEPADEATEADEPDVTGSLPEKISVDLGDGVTMEFVLIPAGEFLMGSPDSDRDDESDEKPQHQVRITQPFYLGKREVTQEQWQAVMGSNPSDFKGATKPVESVSWDDCQTFLEKLNRQQGSKIGSFRLPTEAEWEYACRAGTSTRWCFGDDESGLADYAWYDGNSRDTTHPVGQKKPNAWGLCDMHGNVWEWCSDWYGGGYYRESPGDDPVGLSSGSYRVRRGGGWSIFGWRCRSADRANGSPGYEAYDLGFRVSLELVGYVSPVAKAAEALRITPIPPQTVEPGEPLSLAVSVENGEQWDGELQYSLGPGAPDGATIDPETGSLTWTPADEHAPGTYEITVSATGPDGQSDEDSLVVTVTAPVDATVTRLEETTVDLGAGVTMELVLIPAGGFEMGSPDADRDAKSNEKPEHRVRITKPFYLGKYEVTQQQWVAVMGSNPSRLKGPSNPVEQVSWNDCQAFLQKLNQQYASTRATFRLPTEAEWEYACRAGSSTRWSFGDDEASLGEYAWYSANSTSSTHPVGQKRPNAWGLYDVHGNVWEWCSDWYEESYYGKSPGNDPTGPSSGAPRVLRGGSWGSEPDFARSAGRDRFTPGIRSIITGFRVALEAVDYASPLPEAAEVLQITAIPVQTVAPGRVLFFAVSVENAKHWEGKVRFSLGPDAPSDATIDPATGLFGWTPAQRQDAGTYPITVLAAGPDGEADEYTFMVTVMAKEKEIRVDLGRRVTMEMVLVPAGRFMMGSPDSHQGARDEEKPEHQVRITGPFYLGKYEVTQEQWQAVMGSNPSHFKNVRNPVESVSWDDCQAFLEKLNRQHGSKIGSFRFPTEAEWEYACRAGSSTRWCFGDDAVSLGEYAWYDDNSGNTTHPVGQKKANAWGLYDVHGNVWEWCSDWYDGDYYGRSPGNDPTGPSSGSDRVIRGGCWANYPISCRSADRYGESPGGGKNHLGFRVSLQLLE